MSRRGAPGARAARIRLHAIANAAGLAFRSLASTVYAVLVARALGVGDYAAFGLAASLSLAAVAPTTVWGYWAQRAVARGEPGALATGYLATLAYLAAAAPLLALAGYALAGSIGADPATLAAGTLAYAVPTVLYVYTNSMALASAPGRIGPAATVESGVRAAAATWMALAGLLDYWGALAALAAGRAAGIAYLAPAIARGSVGGRPSPSLALAWLRLYRVPLLHTSSGAIQGLHRSLLATVTKSEVPVAYANIAYSILDSARQVLSGVSIPLYARLLAGSRNSYRDSLETLRLVMFVGGGIAAVSAALAVPLATLFSPAYSEAWPLIPLASVAAFVSGVSTVIERTATGIERADESYEPKRVASSILALIPRVRFASTLISTIIATVVAATSQAAVLAAGAFIAATMVSGIAIATTAWRRASIKGVPWREVAATAVGVGASLTSSLVAGSWEMEVLDLPRDAAPLAGHAALALAAYTTAFLAVSPWARLLARRALSLALGR